MTMSGDKPFNPFANMDLSKFDVTKMLGDLKVPGIELESLMEAQRKNMEAVAAANKVAVEGMQAVAKRQAEILAESMASVSSAAQQMSGISSPQDLTAKQAEMVKAAFEKSLANLRELAEMVGKSNSEAFEVINTRFNESLQEVKKLTEAKK
jgi:phasin family protein